MDVVGEVLGVRDGVDDALHGVLLDVGEALVGVEDLRHHVADPLGSLDALADAVGFGGERTPHDPFHGRALPQDDTAGVEPAFGVHPGGARQRGDVPALRADAFHVREGGVGPGEDGDIRSEAADAAPEHQPGSSMQPGLGDDLVDLDGVLDGRASGATRRLRGGEAEISSRLPGEPQQHADSAAVRGLVLGGQHHHLVADPLRGDADVLEGVGGRGLHGHHVLVVRGDPLAAVEEVVLLHLHVQLVLQLVQDVQDFLATHVIGGEEVVHVRVGDGAKLTGAIEPDVDRLLES